MRQNILHAMDRIAGRRAGRITSGVLSAILLLAAMAAGVWFAGMTNVLLSASLIVGVSLIAYWGMSRLTYMLD